jgi:response regulator of citrate/malate metabolism
MSFIFNIPVFLKPAKPRAPQRIDVSLICRVMKFFRDCPDEGLTLDDVCVKFEVSKAGAHKALTRQVERGVLAVGVDKRKTAGRPKSLYTLA